MNSIDLNADLGEGSAYDAELLTIVSSASVACGGHAGSDDIMRETLVAAHTLGVRIGAHPGFVDAEYFGRRELDLPFDTIGAQVIEQITRLSVIGKEVGQDISYLKLHGALYNMASRDGALAAHLFGAVRETFGALPVMALSGSAQIDAAINLGLPVIREGFADRAYSRDGHLVSRSVPDAVFQDAKPAVEQAVRMARFNEIAVADGTVRTVQVQSICLHGDNTAAVELARAVRDGLRSVGIAIRAQN